MSQSEEERQRERKLWDEVFDPNVSDIEYFMKRADHHGVAINPKLLEELHKAAQDQQQKQPIYP